MRTAWVPYLVLSLAILLVVQIRSHTHSDWTSYRADGWQADAWWSVDARSADVFERTGGPSATID